MFIGLLAISAAGFAQTVSWTGTLRDPAGQPLPNATVILHSAAAELTATTASDGRFTFAAMQPARYSVRVSTTSITASGDIDVAPASANLANTLRLTAAGAVLLQADSQSTGGEQLSSRQVSAMPLNKRDFSQLLLLATGTQTDTNGAANFTQQMTVNGQRGTATVFAMDGADTTDPELGGATFSNFNVDAIQEINSSSGVLPAEIGHGAAGFTAITTKSGANEVHGTFFEFIRNAAFDARNFFDRRSIAEPGRLPPFARNEFGLVNGGPVKIPGVYDGRNRTFYFAQYQGFRQVLGTTQIIPVPTGDERRGLDSSAIPGLTLVVPVSPKIAPVLAKYPLPNDPQGPYGARTYATSSKIRTESNQFSVRMDHRLNSKTQLFARFNLNNVNGPTTNPSQTVVDGSFGTEFFDHQRNAAVSVTYTPSPSVTSETAVSWIRSTPNFLSANGTQAGLTFADGLYEPFNSAAGTIQGSYGNLYQFRQNISWVRGKHAMQAGFETRWNRDTTLWGVSPAGSYGFGGGAVYSPVEIHSVGGGPVIRVGDQLPDTLSGFLTATPFQFSRSVAPHLFPQGDHIGEAGVRREAYNFYFRDTWKVAPRVSLNYGLRYEINSRIHEANLQTSGIYFGSGGARFLVNPQPHYGMDWNGLGPRLAVDWQLSDRMVVRAGASITTLLPNLWQVNFTTGGLPYVALFFGAAAPGAPLTFSNIAPGVDLPNFYDGAGSPIFAAGDSKRVPDNTELDVLRFQRDLAARTPGNGIQALQVAGMAPDFGNGYVPSYTAAIERRFGDITINAGYVATAGVRLPRIEFPNAYGGADPAYARYTNFDASGNITGGYGPINVMTNSSHSTYHSLQVSAAKTSRRYGLGFQASYTFSKSLDDTSAVLGGGPSAASGAILQAAPQNPFNLRAEKGPSTFDINHGFSFSAVQELPVRRAPVLGALGRRFTEGWQMLGVVSLASGPPFTVYSGVQQTGLGMNFADRPDQIAAPDLSTARAVREDYFGRGAANPDFFDIPISIRGGTGPNGGRLGSLGRNTFRGPGFHNLDLSVIKDTPIGTSANPERAVLEFRAEVFNAVNLVNFGLPNNVVNGPGFGIINRTSGPSRQIQFSLKIIY